MPSGLSESPNTGGFGGDGGYDSGPSYDANNPSFGSDPTDSNFYNLPPVRTGADGSPDFSSIYTDLNNLGDSGGTYDTSYPTYNAMSPFAFDNMADWANLPPAYDGKNGSLDFQKAALDALDTADIYGKGDEGFWGSEFGKNLKKFGLYALQMHPATRVPMALYNAANAASQGNWGQTLGSIVGGTTGNPLAGSFAGLATDAVMGKPVNTAHTGNIGGTLGGIIGSDVGGPVGGFLGQQLGQRAGVNIGLNAGLPGSGPNMGQGDYGRTNVAQNPNAPVPNQQTKMSGTEAAIGGLAALYMYNQQRGMSKEQAAQMAQLQASQQAMLQQYMQNAQAIQPEMREPDFGSVYAKMDEMYSPTGNIAKELRTQLERKDAASGRRSQYGPREVELLARLSQMRSQYEPAYLNAAAAEANAFNSMSAADANSQRAALQAALQAQGGMSSSQAAALNAQFQQQQARTQQQQQFLNTLYTIGRDQGWWNSLGNMFSGE